jgi:hypothetical protein
MNSQLPPVVGVHTSQKVEVRNVGVARITGSQLLAEGKFVNWLYLITDIGCLATYENQNSNVWLGADGIAVAGNTAVLTSLVPREGQRFYNIQTGQPLLYKGGAWGGASWAQFQVLAPTTVMITASGDLEPQRDHAVVGDDLNLILPSSLVAEDGHIVRIYVPVGSTENAVFAGSGTTITTLDIAGMTSAELLQSQVYEFIYFNTVWYSFTESANLYLRRDNNLADLANKELSRANLEVFSTAQTLAHIQGVEAKVDGGLISEGTVGDPVNPRRFSVDFATQAEVAAGTSTGKAINPAGLAAILPNMIDAAVGSSKYNTVTGLVAGSQNFELTAIQPSTISWTAAEFAINADPALLTSEVTFGTLAAGTIEVPNVAGYVLQRIRCNESGVVSFTTSPAPNPLAIRLGIALVKDGVIQWLLPCPQLGTADYYLRSKAPELTGSVVSVAAPGTSGRLATSSAQAFAESANWVAKTPDLNVLTQPAVPLQTWAYWRTGTLETSTGQTVVDGRLFVDGGTVPAANFTIQNVLRDYAGQLYIVSGRSQFTTMALAIAGLAAATPTVPNHLIGACKEVARIILKGDQHVGNAALNLEDPAKCQIFEISTLGSGTSGSGDSDDVRVIRAPGELQYGNDYVIAADIAPTLPPIGPEGSWLRAKSLKPFRPILNVHTGGNVIVDDETLREDNQLQLDSYKDFIRLYILDGKWRY